jgi:sterol 3beta-glucosyltransferase
MIRSHTHRVRIATHGEFKDLVLSANKHLQGEMGRYGIKLEGRLEFYEAGGDPRELMAYMVKSECCPVSGIV